MPSSIFGGIPPPYPCEAAASILATLELCESALSDWASRLSSDDDIVTFPLVGPVAREECGIVVPDPEPRPAVFVELEAVLLFEGFAGSRVDNAALREFDREGDADLSDCCEELRGVTRPF